MNHPATLTERFGDIEIAYESGGLFDRYRTQPDLDAVAALPGVGDVEFFRDRPKAPEQFREVEFHLPAFYYDLSFIQAVFLADLAALRRLLPTNLVEPVAVAPGTGLLALTAFEYRVTDIDPYNEFAISVITRPPGSRIPGPVSAMASQLLRTNWAFVWKLPVSTEIARYGGVVGYNYPKWVAELPWAMDSAKVTADVVRDGQPEVRLVGDVLPTRPGKVVTNHAMAFKNGEVLDVPVVVNPRQQATSLLGARCRLELGDGPIADTLRGLAVGRLVRYDFVPSAQLALPAGRPVAGRRDEGLGHETSDRVPLLRDLDGLAPGLRSLPPALYARHEKVWRQARSFAREHIHPIAESHEAAMDVDHAHHVPAFSQAAARAGLLSICCFRSLGGHGLGATACGLVLEELCAACAGLGNIIGAHQLGLLGLLFTRNLGLSREIQLEIVRAARRGEAAILAAAVTEPQAGSDVEDREHMKTARIGTIATRVAGGYRLSGTKIFISNGSFARWIVVGAATDRRHPRDTWTMFLVDSRAEGFSVPRVEDKMGMKANPAAELCLEEVFVPDRYVLSDRVGDGMESTEIILAASRGPVGAIANGIARGALERFLVWAGRAPQGGDGAPPIEDRAIQDGVASCFELVGAGRGTWLAAALAFDHVGFGALADSKLVALHALPGADLATRLFSRSSGRRQWLGRLLDQTWGGESNDRVLATSSLAKRTCSDSAMTVIGRLMDLMGAAALDPAWGLEKAWRDARLTQIYEGTNQLNRLCLYDKGVSP